MKKRTIRTLWLGWALALSGCSITQQVTVDATGQAVVAFDMAIDQSMLTGLGMTIAEFCSPAPEAPAGDSGLTALTELFIQHTDAVCRTTLRGPMARVFSPPEGVLPEEIADGGDFQFVDEGNGVYRLTVVMTGEEDAAGEPGEGEASDNEADAEAGGGELDAIPDDVLRQYLVGRFLTIRVTAPSILASNGQIEGNTATFRIAMGDVIAGPPPAEDFYVRFSLAADAAPAQTAPGQSLLPTRPGRGQFSQLQPVPLSVQRQLSGHEQPITAAAFSYTGLQLAAAAADGTVRIWDVATGALLTTFSGHTGAVHAIAFSRAGQLVATASADRNARLWHAGSGNTLLVLSGHRDAVESVAFSMDGLRLVTGSRDQTARIWSGITGEPLRVLTGHTGSVLAAAFSADGRRVITASADGTARIWDATSGALLDTLSGHTGPVRAAAFSPDGQRALTLGDDGIRIWNFGVNDATLAITAAAVAAQFTETGEVLALEAAADMLRIRNVTTQSIIAVLPNSNGAISTVILSADGTRVATYSAAGMTVELWSVVPAGP